MKKILYILTLSLTASACSNDFLERTPRGRLHHGNYQMDSIDGAVLGLSRILESYSGLREWAFVWPGLAMNNYTTPDANTGSEGSDGGLIRTFESFTFISDNPGITDYYRILYSSITQANQGLALVSTMTDGPDKSQLTAEALFLRSMYHYFAVQAFGNVPLVTTVMGPNDPAPGQTPKDVLLARLVEDLTAAIPHLPTRKDRLAARSVTRYATQNGARALLAKIYLYQGDYAGVMTQTSAIIASGDNDLSTPYDRIFDEDMEYGPESVLEVFAERRPTEQLDISSPFGEIQGVRGLPNLGWGFNSPSTALMNAYETGDPRKVATVISNGDDLEGDIVQAPVAMSHPYFNKKAYCKRVERTAYGRDGINGTWKNIRIIRYSDVLLMHAEAANELNNSTEALEKLEMVRARARGGNNAVLPKVTDTDQTILRDKIRHERRIELALEFGRFFDLVRWGVAKDVIGSRFVVGKHEVFPIPQNEIDRSNGALIQNPGY